MSSGSGSARRSRIVSAAEGIEQVETAPDGINADEALKLWVRAGGRCAFCNTHLLEHEFTAMNINTGEMAHIVGRAKSSRSPRGLDDLPVERRNLADNLVLLCPSDHRAIDKKLGAAIWTIDDLRDLKRRHEDRIHYLTGLGDDAETVVLRMIGSIRGATVEASSESVRRATFSRLRYPRYALGDRRESDIEIDLRALPGEGEDVYWETARRRIHEVVSTQLASGVERGHVRHLSVFALARIPALVLLGDALDDKIPVDLYEHHRDGLGWEWAEGEEPATFQVRQLQSDSGSDQVTLLCSISGSVSLSDLSHELTAGAVYEIAPNGCTPRPDLLRVPESVTAFSATYRLFLAQIERDHPGLAAIDVVPAVPVTAAIELGRRRMRDVHPVLRIWDRADGEYAFALVVGQ